MVWYSSVWFLQLSFPLRSSGQLFDLPLRFQKAFFLSSDYVYANRFRLGWLLGLVRGGCWTLTCSTAFWLNSSGFPAGRFDLSVQLFFVQFLYHNESHFSIYSPHCYNHNEQCLCISSNFTKKNLFSSIKQKCKYKHFFVFIKSTFSFPNLTLERCI